MAYTIKFLSLQKSELEYEVELRGGVGDSVQELRKQIVKLSQQLPSEDILESYLEPADDLKGVKESLIKSQGNLNTLKTKFDKNLFNRTENLLNHLYHRLSRIVAVADVAEIYKICNSNFNTQHNELSALRPHSSQTKTMPSTSDSTLEATTAIAVTCERSLTADVAKLRYSGKSCVRSFIQKVEEFVLSRGIAYDKILSLAYEIFTDDALHWYRCNKDKIKSWQELRDLLKDDFSSKDYDYWLAAEIRARTQGETENITIYLSIMHGMFSRLTKPFSEAEKLEILLHNIRPSYASSLAASPEIQSIDTLKNICRNYENIQSRFANYHEPPKVTRSTLAPEFAYKQPENVSSTSTNKSRYFNYKNTYTNSNLNSITKTNTNYSRGDLKSNQNDIAVAAISAGPPTRYCPRCRTDSHTLRTCKEERFLVCFKCGKKDVRYTDCPNCCPTSINNPKN